MFDVGSYPQALEKYEQAAKLREDPDVTAQIAEARLRIQLGVADALRDAKKYDESLAAYEEARQLKPSEAALIDARQADVRIRQQYDEQIAKGDSAAAQGRWVDALGFYRAAKAIRPTAEADQRITNTRYSENLAKGKQAMDAGDLRGARAYFNIAKGYLDTEEVNSLIEQVEKKLEQEQR